MKYRAQGTSPRDRRRDEGMMNPYGVREANNIAEADYDHTAVDYSYKVDLSDERLVRIDRIRLLTEPGFPMYDLSYCWGTLDDGRHVPVDLGRYQFTRRPRGGKGPSLHAQLVDCAKAAGRHAKRLGMLDDSTISILF
jgi:hypothetical protein